MKKTAVGFAVLLFVVQCRAQVQWSPPVQISHGHGDDTHPSFANSMYGFGDMLTFSRFDSQRYSICIVTNSFASNWDDTTIFIAHDSVRLDYPTLTESGSFPSKRMLVWQRGDTLRNLWFSSDFGGGWSMPAPLTNDTLDNRFPYLSPTYNGDVFGLVWQRADRIAFTEFTTGSWLPPISISDSSDTITARPSLKYTIEVPGVSNPLVVWGGKEFLFPSLQYEPVVRYAVRTGNGWFISLLGVNTDAMYHPRLIKNSPWGADLTYEGWDGTNWEIYAGGVDVISYWGHNLSNSPLVDDRGASFAATSIITAKSASSGIPYFMAGTWKSTSSVGDSIAVLDRTRIAPYYLNASPGTAKANPDISCGLGWGYWSAWESNETGDWKVFGSYAQIPLDVNETAAIPKIFRLYQNYPNPFNPGTTIEFSIPSAQFVMLKVYNLLGQEVVTLVNGLQTAGVHSVQWNASSLSTGFYFYKMETGKFSQTRKLMLMK